MASGRSTAIFRSVQSRILALVLPAAILVVILASALVAWDSVRNEDARFERRTIEHMRTWASLLVEGVEAGDDVWVDKVLTLYMREPDITAARVRDAEGRVMAEIAQGDVLDSRLFEVPIIAPDGRDLGTIETAASPTKIERILWRDAGKAGLIVAAVAAVTLFTAFGIVRWLVVRPIARLTRAMEAHAAGTPLPPVRADGDDEIQRLCRAFNEMAARLAAREEELVAANARLATQSDLLDQAKRLAEIRQVTAEAANRSRSRFLANMSHELRTPLNAVIGFAEMMHTHAFGKLGHPNYEEYAKLILESANHLLELVNSVLDMAKLESKAFSIQPEPLPLRPLVDQSVELLRPLAKQNGVEVTVLPMPVASVSVDLVAFRQIVMNLLSNALKFTPRDGKVTFSATLRGDRCVLSIADTGIGIPSADLDRVLRPFEQLDSSYAKHASGTGLGLPIAKSLVELHGGRLVLDSDTGRGTTVTFDLPLVTEAAAAEPG